MNAVLTRRRPELFEDEIEAREKQIDYLHSLCVGCECQHKVGNVLARGYEKSEVSSVAGNGDADSKDGSPS